MKNDNILNFFRSMFNDADVVRNFIRKRTKEELLRFIEEAHIFEKSQLEKELDAREASKLHNPQNISQDGLKDNTRILTNKEFKLIHDKHPPKGLDYILFRDSNDEFIDGGRCLSSEKTYLTTLSPEKLKEVIDKL